MTTIRLLPPALAACRRRAVPRRWFASMNGHHDHHGFFRKVIGENGVVTDADLLRSYNVDWMKKYKGQSGVVLLPKTTEQVSQLLAYCNAQHIPVVPQGGNTGLVGGSVPVHDEVIMSMARMNQIQSLDDTSGVLMCEAGCILENLEVWLGERGYTMPLDLGAKGSCQIGGNISTCAGGTRFVRYGSLHSTVLGLEVVLANGTVLDMMSVCRKDVTGYDMKHLFIGAEGTLGVVTRCAIHVPRLPASRNVAFLALDSFRAVLDTYAAARKGLGEVLSAVEFMDGDTVRMVHEQCGGMGLRSPVDRDHRFYMLIEASGSNDAHDGEKMEAFLEGAMGQGLVLDGVLSQDTQQLKDMWAFREHAAIAVGMAGGVYKYDISLPLRKFYTIVEDVRERLRRGGLDAAVVGYGHIGDGNLHLNVVSKDADAKVLALLEPYVFEWVVRHSGSISAEHGIGRHKLAYLPLQKPKAVLKAMADLKRLFDPHGILNPHKVVPAGH